MPSDPDALKPFDASASAIGYAFQLRVALERAWELKGTGLDWSICIEGRDDVEHTTTDGSTLEQHKQHADATPMTDNNVDLWKTLRIWCTGVSAGVIDLKSTDLLLITSSEIAVGSAASLLQRDDRDPGAALSLLQAAAKSSTNKTLTKSMEAWNALSQPEQIQLLECMTVVGESPNIEMVHDRLLKIAGYAVKDEYRAAFVEYLEGWWFNRCIESLRADDSTPVSGEEFDASYHRIKDQFNAENLPIDDQVRSFTVSDIGELASRCFVRQLQLSEIGSKRILTAVRDYLRASSQRSMWLRQKLVWPQELNRYEAALIEAWEIVFDREVDSLGEDATLEKKKAAAAAIYRWVEDAAAPPLRPRIPDAFLTRGSLHILADDRRVGWHPDYRDLVEEVIGPLVVA
jgi:hypothetical protein